jgi:probable rRNA maturation factor
MTVELELQIATTAKTLPHPSQFKEWVGVIFAKQEITLNNPLYANKLSVMADDLEITIRIVDEPEITHLNNRYRHKNLPTNVLSFTCEIEQEFNYNLLGDIVICAPVVEYEAKQQDKDLLSHWAHMVIHGTLHLLGYDHQLEAEAIEMEKIEINLMKQLGFASPYS